MCFRLRDGEMYPREQTSNHVCPRQPTFSLERIISEMNK